MPKYEKLFVVAVNVERTGQGLVEVLADISETNFQVYSETQITKIKALFALVVARSWKFKNHRC